MILPLDVLETIIDLLALEGDLYSLETIKAFSISCHSILHCCRKHIFKAICVDVANERSDPTGKVPSMAALCALISATPQLADYVRTLSLGISNDPAHYTTHSHLPDIFSRFRRIKSLTLDVMNGEFQRVHWAAVMPSVRQAIIGLVQLDSLHSLKLRMIKFPFLHVKLGCNLRRLELDQFHCLDTSPDTLPPDENVVPLRLHEFSMGCFCGVATSKILQAGQSPNVGQIYDFSQLRNVQATCYTPGDMDALQSLITGTVCLETVDITVNTKCSLNALVGALGQSSKTLRTISIRNLSHGIVNFILTLSKEIAAFGPVLGVLKRIFIYTHVDDIGALRNISDDLEDLARSLRTSTRPLQTVYIEIQIDRQGKISGDEAVVEAAKIKQKFSSLCSCKVTLIDVVVL